ncbi:MAG: hypothetical protein LKG27_07600 [Clostridiaceae bacterium]|jgi:DNA-binding NarL/FixJ family response regulator|nr:hypothetical protein [Clostridiaceae bacterium]
MYQKTLASLKDMKDKNNIVIISENEEQLKVLLEKVILLRQSDNVVAVQYSDAEDAISKLNPQAILVCENVDQNLTLELISNIKKMNKICSIILLTSNYDQDFILSAYDLGADDFCSVNAESFELVIRVIRNLKNISVKKVLAQSKKLLSQNMIIDEITGFYGYKYAAEVYDSHLAKNLEETGTFMILSPSEDEKKRFSVEKLAKCIKSSVRFNDISALGRAARFYIMLPNSDKNGAIKVFEKISALYSSNNLIKAGVYEYKAAEDFKHIEKNTLNALSEAMLSDDAYRVAETKKETLDSWLDSDEETPKDFKIFKQVFNKKVEKVIAPVFYRLQQIYEDKLYNTKVNQYVNEDECVFHLKNSNQDSKLKIVYPGFSKIILYIVHEGLDSPENSEKTLPLSKITQDELVKIVEDFIKDFILATA